MSFVDEIFEKLDLSTGRTFLRESYERDFRDAKGRDLLHRIRLARGFFRQHGLHPGDRYALVATNSIDWVAIQLAALAEGIVTVPLYARQSVDELAGMLSDCRPKLVLCGELDLKLEIETRWTGAPIHGLVETIEISQGEADPLSTRPAHTLKEPAEPTTTDGAASDPAPPSSPGSPTAPGDTGDPAAPGATAHAAGADDDSPGFEKLAPLAPDDPVVIFYTSGTSGEPKGVVITERNVSFMLGCAGQRLDRVMGRDAGNERAFHYLPFCFAGSWISLVLALTRRTRLTLNTDLSRLIEDVREARPQYFQNVPLVLERMRAGVEQGVERRGGAARRLFARAMRAVAAEADGGKAAWADSFSRAVVRRFFLPTVRKRLGPDLRALICGSAPLARETQLFFELLGVPVLQVYGLTETTAILTMDDPGNVVPGCVGQAIPGVEMKLAPDGEILARGPNVFPGYWNRDEETRATFDDGWFHTGDLGEVTSTGHWRVLGRKKNLIVPASGHNVAPEPIEERIAELVPEAQQVVLIGTGRAHLAVIVTGPVAPASLEAALADLNRTLPHHERVRSSLIVRDPFTVESGLVTANGKLRRDELAARLAPKIDELYRRNTSRERAPRGAAT